LGREEFLTSPPPPFRARSLADSWDRRRCWRGQRIPPHPHPELAPKVASRPRTRSCFSWSDSRAPEWVGLYCQGGIDPERMASIISSTSISPVERLKCLPTVFDVLLYQSVDRCDVRVPRPLGQVAVTVHARVGHQLFRARAVPRDLTTTRRGRVVATVGDELDRNQHHDKPKGGPFDDRTKSAAPQIDGTFPSPSSAS
jgi:hypothetical protein